MLGELGAKNFNDTLDYQLLYNAANRINTGGIKLTYDEYLTPELLEERFQQDFARACVAAPLFAVADTFANMPLGNMVSPALFNSKELNFDEYVSFWGPTNRTLSFLTAEGQGIIDEATFNTMPRGQDMARFLLTMYHLNKGLFAYEEYPMVNIAAGLEGAATAEATADAAMTYRAPTNPPENMSQIFGMMFAAAGWDANDARVPEAISHWKLAGKLENNWRTTHNDFDLGVDLSEVQRHTEIFKTHLQEHPVWPKTDIAGE